MSHSTGSRSRVVSAIAAWLPVVFWALLIARGAGDEFAARRTLISIEWLIRSVWPGATIESLYLANFVARKLAHVTEYAIFAILLLRAFRSGTGPAPRSPAAVAVIVAALLSLFDEGRQALSSERTGSLLDCVTDLGGAALGGLFWRRRR